MSNHSSAPVTGYWPLRGDASDHSDASLHARVHGDVQLEADAAVFNGRGGYLEIPHHQKLRLGRDPFSLTARIWIAAHEAEVIGDIASKFDPATRTGFNFSVADHGGVTSACSNYRNLNFSIDAGSAPEWTDCGRLGNATMVYTLTVHNGSLYAGTFELGDGVGHVYRYIADGRWEDTGLPCKANAVCGMASVDGILYATSGMYDSRGSALDMGSNPDSECRVWRMESDGIWKDCGAPPGGDDLLIMGVYRGKIYVTPNYRTGLYRYEGGKTWTTCAAPYPRFFTLSQWRGHLYAGTNKSLRRLGPPPKLERIYTFLPDADAAYRYDDQTDTWTGCGPIPDETQMYCFSVHRGAMHVGTWPNCKIFRSTTGIGWEDCGRFDPAEEEVMGVGIYNGMMYCGTLPAADIYRFDGDHQWTQVGQTDQTPNVRFRRAWSMAVHDGRLFVGTLPSGHAFSMRVGAVAADSHELKPGWHDVAAVRDAADVKLYIDGQLRAQGGGGAGLDLSNDQPLRIGFGAYDYFRGKIADVRLHAGALNAQDLQK